MERSMVADIATADSNLLVNGSFEATALGVGKAAGFQSIAGWTALTGGTIELWNAVNGVTATQGVNFAELDYLGGYDGFYQDVGTTAGQAYTLSFDLRSRPSYAISTQGVEVVWNGQVVATTYPGTAWSTFSVNVNGTGGQDRLTIREVQGQSGDGIGALLDNFRLVAGGTPNQQPASTLLSFANQGGAGADTFVYTAATAGGDTITDFVSSLTNAGTSDFLSFSASGFGGGLVPGGTAPLIQASNPIATGSKGQFLFDKDDGRVMWDADGVGSGSPVLVATLTGVTSLSANDFLIVA